MRCEACHRTGFLLSVAVHAGLLAAFLMGRVGHEPVTARERELPLQLSMFVDALPVTAVTEVLPPPEPEPMAPVEPPPPAEMPLPRTPAPAPKVKPPRSRPAVAPKQPTEARQPPVTAAAPVAAPTEPVAPATNPAEAEHLRAAYLQRLVALIDARKFYPEGARKRGITGVVQVSFTLHRDGSISDLNAGSGQAILRDAAMESVRRAAPLPAVPEKVACPLPVSYGMEFRIN